MKSETKANVILYFIVVILITIIIAGLGYLYKASEFKIVKDAVNNFKENENYTYKVYKNEELEPSYTIKYLNKRYRIFEKGIPGFEEGDLNKKEAIHFLPQKEVYTPVKKEDEFLKLYPDKINKKYTIIDFFKGKSLRKQNENGEKVLIYEENDENNEKKIYKINTKNKTIKEYKKGDINLKYDIELGNVQESDVEPIDRNKYEVKIKEDFENIKNDLIKELEEDKENESEKAKPEE